METSTSVREHTSSLDSVPRHRKITVAIPPEVLLRQIYSTEDQTVAIETAKQIPSIDCARRIQAYVDIHGTFSNAMSEQDQHELIDLILADVIEFSGERLPDDAAQRVGIPEEYVTNSRATGVIDYADIEAVFRVWDDVVRSEMLASIIDAYLDQFAKISDGNARQAELLKQAFKLSLKDGTKVADNERRLLRNIQNTGSINRFNDDEAQNEALRIAAEWDRKRILGNSALRQVS